jgi:hypothetical protein
MLRGVANLDAELPKSASHSLLDVDFADCIQYPDLLQQGCAARPAMRF